jgi:carboxyl-terminal processing protease
LFVLGATFGIVGAMFVAKTDLLSTTAVVAAPADTYRNLRVFGDVFDKIRTDYVEEVDETKLIEAAINGMLTSLDPHSGYLDEKSYADMQENTRGEFGGLGMEVTMEDGLVKVVAPIDDTPAARAGIMANDRISQIDDEPVMGLTLSQAVDRLRGEINSKVTLKVLRAGAKEPLEFTLTRETIRVRPVKARAEGDVIYLRLSQFNEQSYDNLRSSIDDITSKIGPDKVKGFVLDLRNNPGGLLEQAIRISDAFLDRGEIVSTRGRDPDEIQRASAKPGDLTKGKPLVVLINGGSASASEIVAGALQDHKRATLIGTRSFGKGSVQTIIPIAATAGVRLTTARYYTPSGRSIQATGIEPDYEVLQDVPDELKGYDQTRGEAGLRGHLRNTTPGEEGKGSSAYVPLDPAKDLQLKAALDFINTGRIPEPPAKTSEKQSETAAASPAPVPSVSPPATPPSASPAPLPPPAVSPAVEPPPSAAVPDSPPLPTPVVPSPEVPSESPVESLPPESPNTPVSPDLPETPSLPAPSSSPTP